MKYKTKLDSSILISHKKVRTAEVHVVGTSIDTCVESISNSNMKDYGGMASCEIALIHEHDFSVLQEKRNLSFVVLLAVFISVGYVVRYWLMYKFIQINYVLECKNKKDRFKQ